MQEIKKRRIVLASVLKPVNDVRMFEKFGHTLAKSSDVHLIGFPAKTYPEDQITYHALPPFKRISLRRLTAPWIILSKVAKIRPKIFIITTHELLLTALFAKILLRCRLIYDVQENYARNILFTDAFPKILRPLLATWVRLKEWLAKAFIDHYFLAEAGYEQEMNFPKGRFTVIENKVRRRDIVTKKDRHPELIRLVFTGTLSKTTGVFTAIKIAEALYALDHSIRLTIIGYASLESTYQKILEQIQGKDFITLVGGDKLIPHHDIMEVIARADFGIIAYPPNPATKNSIPTKLYEYLGCQLPILLTDHPRWTKICAPFPAAITFKDGDVLDAVALLRSMKDTVFYRSIPNTVYWESDAEQLLKVLSQLR